MDRRLIPGFILVAAILFIPVSVWAEEIGCYSFNSWDESQKYFEKKGGSKFQNVDELDSDQDGLACEELIGFKANHINPNNEKKPAPLGVEQSPKKSWSAQILSFLKDLWFRVTGS
ncbi:MAG: hypothetical protein WB502_12905 [Thermoactinomyces sp.]